MKNTNGLASFFNYLGEVFEKFNPAAFRFLAAFLPYMTPIPVAAISQVNATKFLNLPPSVSFIFVFGLEGIGLWFTSLFVDSVVEAIRSRNWKAWLNVLMFAVAVTVYVVILVNINVIIEQSSGNTNPAYSRVITLLCFLPLITGIGNGYYKLKLEQKTNLEMSQEREFSLQDKIRQENNDLKLKKALIKAGRNPFETPAQVYQETVVAEKQEKEKKASDYKVKIWQYLDEQYAKGKILKVVEITEHFHLPYDKAKGFVSTQRTLWAADRQADLGKRSSTS